MLRFYFSSLIIFLSTIGLEVSKTNLSNYSCKESYLSYNESSLIVFQQGEGKITITSSPEEGMLIFLNDRSTGKSTPATIDGVAPGEHSIKLIGQWYKPQEKKVIVSGNETATVEFTMVPNFAELTINTSFDGAIYIDGIRKGTTTWKGRAQEGERNIKVEKENMVPREQKVLVVRGRDMQIDLMMKPRTGGIEIVTNPEGAMIDVNGRLYGLTPNYISDLLPGDYNVIISKPGFTTITRKVRVVDGQTEKLDFKLLYGKEITLATDPQGAQIFLNDTLLGTTPFRISLGYGNHILKITKDNYLVVERINVAPTGQAYYSFVLKESKDAFEGQMILVKGGTFKMGDTFGGGAPSEKPVRIVTVRDFYISKFEITQAQWKEMMGSNPSHFEGCDQCPIERVSWNEVQEFIKKLNLLTGKNYRLPTEAEWEYAARGGQNSKGYRYAGSNNINFVAWYSVNSGNKTQPVGKLPPNELGLYDMSGNVWEWCSDWEGDYPSTPDSNPTGPETGGLKVVRGGSWFGYIDGNRVCSRGFDDPTNGRSYLGFRLALTP